MTDSKADQISGFPSQDHTASPLGDPMTGIENGIRAARQGEACRRLSSMHEPAMTLSRVEPC